MGLSRLDNFLKNSRGDILYVDPSSIDSTDSIENQGNSLVRPFKTIQRALIEAARFSYQKGLDNDRFSRTTIIVYPGEHLIDNRPGWIPIHNNPLSGNNWLTRNGTGTNELSEFDLNTNFDIDDNDNELYKMNSVYGGVIIPRGTSIVGMDLRKTKIRPKFVPDPSDNQIERTCLFRVTGTCYFYQFTFFDADPNAVVFKDYSALKYVPNFSHHKLTCFEYADGINPVKFNDNFLNYSTTRTDLDVYYEKIGLVYGPSSGREISPDFPDSGLDVQSKIDEYRIVGSKGQNVGISSIKSGDGVTATNIITVDIVEDIGGLDVDTPIRIEGVPTGGYNGSYVINTVESPTQITYEVSTPPANPLPTIVSGAPTLNIVVDSVTSASPYIFNCSLRSVYGMCGLHADGSKADGFKSMVIAQFTGIGLQKDDNAFVKYNPVSGVYEDSTAVTNLHTNSSAIYKPEYENFHVKASNDAFLQLVSVFAIGYANHYIAESGGDHSITNSNSNFGAKAIVCKGFRNNAFPRDDTGYITHILPPQRIEDNEISIEFAPIDVEKTISIGNTSRLYLYNEFNQNNPPKSVIEGYRIGAKDEDRLKMTINVGGVGVTKEARIVMPETQGTGDYEITASKVATVGRTSIGINSITSNIFTLTEPHYFLNGESIRVLSDDGELPDGLDHNQVYYAITSGINSDQIKLAQTLNDTVSLSAVTINSKGGILQIQSRVSDKKSGDLGHPIQYDDSVNQWYITVSDTENTIYDTIVGFGTASLGSATPKTFISRTPDNRPLEDRIYKVRYVVPKDSTVLGRAPEDAFVIQESGTTTGFTNDEVSKFKSVSPVTISNSSELRNPRFISGAVWDGTAGITTITTEVPHELSVGSKVQIFNVVSTANTTGLGNTGFNGVYTVTGRPSRREFTIGVTTNPGIFNNDIDIRTTDLPRYERKEFNNTLFIYKREEVEEYIPNVRDGVYHLTLIDASSTPQVSPFQNLRFSQPLQNLYPQLDRDNPTSDPDQTRTFALPTPIGLTKVNDPKNSITKEVINKNIRDFVVGIGIVDIQSSSGISHTITTQVDHGLNSITKVGITSAGLNYGDGSGSTQTLYNARLVGFAGSTTGQYATANIQIDAAGSITDIRIVDGGSAFGIGNTLAVVGVGTTTGWVEGYVTVDQIHNSVGDIIRIDGIRDDRFTDYNTLYKIESIDTGDDQNVTVSSASTIYARYPFTGPQDIAGINTNGLSNISGTILSDVTAYVTGESIGISSITYDNVSGISSVTTSNSHGLLVGNRIKIGGLSNEIYNGEFTVTGVLNVNEFTMSIGVGTTSVLPSGNGFIYLPGFTAQNDIVEFDDEAASSRLVPQYAGITTTLSVALTDPTINVLTVTNASHRGWDIGDYLIVNNEIMRINETVVSDTAIDVLRGLFGSEKQSHPVGSVVRRVRFKPIEFRRNSIIRASGHTFEYLGFGPGNYSTALPERQDRQFKQVERLLSQSVSVDAGTPFYNGLDDKGNSYTINKFTSGATGQDLLTNAPIPTVTGEDITSNSGAIGYDVTSTETVSVNRGIKVDGGKDRNIISEFNGPVVFSEKVTVNNPVEANSILIQGDQTIAREYTVGISTPNLAGNLGDIRFNAQPQSGGVIGWVYTKDNLWKDFGPVQSTSDPYYVGFWSGTFKGDGAGLTNVSDVWVFDGVGISTTTNVGIETTQAKVGYSLYAAGAVLFENTVEFRSDSVLWNVPSGFLVNTGITTFNQQVNFNTIKSIGISTFQNDVLITTNADTIGDTEGNYLRFQQTDLALNASYFYGGLKFEGNDVGNNGERGYIKGVSEGTSGQFALVFGTQGSGPSAPQERLRINNAGNATFSGTVTANSDARLKENVVGISNALSKVLELRGVEYNRIGQPEKEIGLIAQEVEKVFPELIHESPDGIKSVAYQNMVAILIEAVKEQQEQINELTRRVEELES
jgi:hypothetical protein